MTPDRAVERARARKLAAQTHAAIQQARRIVIDLELNMAIARDIRRLARSLRATRPANFPEPRG